MKRTIQIGDNQFFSAGQTIIKNMDVEPKKRTLFSYITDKSLSDKELIKMFKESIKLGFIKTNSQFFGYDVFWTSEVICKYEYVFYEVTGIINIYADSSSNNEIDELDSVYGDI